MRYVEIVDYPRHWDQIRFPVIAHIEIEAKNLEQLERRAIDQTKVRVLGHDDFSGGLIVVHVGCADDEAKCRFQRRWSA